VRVLHDRQRGGVKGSQNALATIDVYSTLYPPEVQATLQRIRATIRIGSVAGAWLREHRQRLDARNNHAKRA